MRGLELVCTPARHASGRMLLDQDAQAVGGLRAARRRSTASGSRATPGSFPAMRDIGERLGPFDLTMIEAGQYDRAWPDWHLGPEQAVRAHQMVGGRVDGAGALGAVRPRAITAGPSRSSACWRRRRRRGVDVIVPRPGESIEPARHRRATRWWPDVPVADRGRSSGSRDEDRLIDCRGVVTTVTRMHSWILLGFFGCTSAADNGDFDTDSATAGSSSAGSTISSADASETTSGSASDTSGPGSVSLDASTSGSSDGSGIFDVAMQPDIRMEEGCSAVDFLFVIDNSGAWSDNQVEPRRTTSRTFIDGIQSRSRTSTSTRSASSRRDAYAFNGPAVRPARRPRDPHGRARTRATWCAARMPRGTTT